MDNLTTEYMSPSLKQKYLNHTADRIMSEDNNKLNLFKFVFK